MCDCVQLIIGPILFLCKDGAYSTEQEYRVLLPADIGDPRVQLATHMRESECAFRTYIQTENFLFEDEGYKILIGPKVKNKAALEQELRWRLAKLEAKTGISYTDNVEIKHSEIGYR